MDSARDRIVTDWRSHLAGITENANAMRKVPIAEEDWGDAPQVIRNAEIVLAEVRRDIEKEISEGWEILADEGHTPVPIEGEFYEVVPKFQYEWTFNPSAILRDAMDAAAETLDREPSIADGLILLQSHRALTLKWSITGLRAAFEKMGLDLLETRRGRVDDDLNERFHAGRVLKKIGVERRKKEETQ